MVDDTTKATRPYNTDHDNSGREIDEFRSFFGEPDAGFERTWITYILKPGLTRR